MTLIAPYEREHLRQMTTLINHHISAVVPGWALPAEQIEAGLQRNPDEYVIDPWVVERKTLCALEKHRVVGAAHLLRYGTEDTVGEHYKGVGDISWFLAWPGHDAAANALLDASHQQMAAWGAKTIFAWNNSLPITAIGDIPDVWPHIARWFTEAGYSYSREEARFGGWLKAIPPPDAPPLHGLICKRFVRSNGGFTFSAVLEGEEIGSCEVTPDLTLGGTLPALYGWAELSEMEVHERWRSQGVGTWLVRHAVDWLRLAGSDRIVLAVDVGDEARGAGRFYERFGWNVLTRLQVGWRKER